MSIKWRLTLWYSLILGLVLASFSAFVYLELRHTLEGGRLAEDRRLAEVMVATLKQGEPTPGGSGEPFGAGFDFSDEQLIQAVRGRDVYLRLVSPVGLVTSEGPQPFPVPKVANPQVSGSWVQRTAGRYTVVVNAPVRSDGRWLGTVQVFERLDALEEELEVVRSLLLLGSLLGVGISWIGGFALTRVAFRPVDRIVNEVERIGPHDLDHRLDERAAGSELRRLVQTFNRMLERLDASFARQRQFVGDASHDLHTPLAAILNHADLLERWGREDPQVLAESISFIQKDARRMERIVGDLLFLARTDSAELPPAIPVALRGAAQEVVAEDRLLAGERQVFLEPGEPVTVRADRETVRRVISELVQNAVKFTRSQGSIRLEVASDGERGWVTVTDDGSGIPPEDLPHVFERFYRVDKARTRQAGGTGLGLAIVKSLAEAYGGRVSATSVLGQGSAFTVELPLAPSETRAGSAADGRSSS